MEKNMFKIESKPLIISSWAAFTWKQVVLLGYSLKIVSRVELKAELSKFGFIISHLKEQTTQKNTNRYFRLIMNGKKVCAFTLFCFVLFISQKKRKYGSIQHIHHLHRIKPSLYDEINSFLFCTLNIINAFKTLQKCYFIWSNKQIVEHHISILFLE